MATRLRLTADAAPITPGTVRGSWDRVITTALAMSPTPTAASSTSSTSVNSTAVSDVVIRTFVSPAMLSAGALAGTVGWVIGASETNAALKGFFHVHIYVTVGDTDTVRGTLLTDYIGTTEFGTTQTGMAVTGLALASVGCQVGDRIVAVVGYRATSSSTTYSGRIGYGSAGSDLTAGSTATTTSPGWFEFSGADPLFQAGTPAAATVAGAGAVTAGAVAQRAAAAAVTGAGQVTATAQQDQTAQATVAGAGAVSAGGARVQPAAAAVAGAGAVTATARLTQVAQATVAGAGQMSASAGAQAAATVGGAGAVSAAAQQGFAAQATVSGAGVVTAGAAQAFGAAATVAGAGAVTALASRGQQAQATVAGAGAVTATGVRVHNVQATVAGQGTVTASGTAVRPGAATVAGAGRITATATTLALLNASIWAVDRATGALLPLPHWVQLNISPIRNSPGAVSVQYPVRGKNFDLLRAGTLGDGTDVEVEVWLGGSRASAMRALLMQTEGEDLDGRATWTFSGMFLERLLDEGIIGPQTPPTGSDKQDLTFTAASVGTIVATVLQQCQTRGALTAITRDFTTTLDSGGVAWPSSISLSFPPKTTLLAVLQRLNSYGLCEFAVTAGRVLQVWRPEGRGMDRSIANDAPMFRHRRVLDAARRHTVLDSYTAALGVGQDGVYAWASDATAQARRGRRIESGVDVGELSDTGSVQAAAQRQLAVDVSGQTELVYELAFGVGDPVPGRGFDVGDWVSCDTRQTRERLRVVQWTLTLDRDHGASGSATMNDLLADRRQRLQAQLDAVTSGAVVVGSNPTGPDTTVPAAPTGLNGSSIAYQDSADAQTYASVTVGWGAVTTNTDGSAADDVAGYRVQYAYVGSSQVGPIGGTGSTIWREATPPGGVTGTSATFGGIGAGASIALRVTAFDRSNHQSAWSSSLSLTTEVDNLGPPTPAPPTASIWFRTIDITSNGRGASGEDMPLDWAGTEVWISRSASITVPTAATDPAAFDPAATGAQHVANLGPSAGTWNVTDLPVGVGYYCALRSFDQARNVSALSAIAGPFTAEQLVSQDLLDSIISAPKIADFAVSSAKIVDAAVVRAKIGDLAVNDAKVETLSVGKITTGTLVATVTMTGIIQTAATGLRWRGDPSGIHFYNSAGALTMDLRGDSGSALITGTIQSATSGTRWVMMPDGTLRLYGPGSGYAQMYNFGGGNDIVLRGRLDSNDRSGRINAGPVGAGMVFASEDELPGSPRSLVAAFDRAVELNAPEIRFRVNLDNSPVSGDPRAVFGATSSGGDVGGSGLQYIYTPSGGTGGQSTKFANGSMNVAVAWRPGVILITNADGSSYAPINASAFNVSSSEGGKTNIRPLDGALAAKMASAKARRYQRLADVTPRPPNPPGRIEQVILDRNGQPIIGPDGQPTTRWVPEQWAAPQPAARDQIGLLAEELQVGFPELVRPDPADPTALVVDVYGLTTVLWQRQLDDDIRHAALTARVAALEGRPGVGLRP